MRLRRCQHLNTRCLHGDEILRYVKVPWFSSRPDVIRRQLCLDCGKALDRNALCTILGEDVHEWHAVAVCQCSVHDITRLGAAHADWCPMAD